jgi:hypothetical protein
MRFFRIWFFQDDIITYGELASTVSV